ncbi:DUF5050 domain-containing protein [Dehalobacter sp. TBBPA1]|uniref:cell wall-binding repeat-containing protein n=1 Tax=Dehalobacter sp. TBBPA1 TaxID=3235037 RepID=UPI0034A57C3D
MAVISNFAKELKLSTVYVATGSNYPDALAASALAAKTHSPVFLVNDTAVDKTKEYLLQNQILPNIVAIGQTDVVSDGVVKELLQNRGNTNGNLQLNKPGIDENYTVLPYITDIKRGNIATQGVWDYFYLRDVSSQFGGQLFKIRTDGSQCTLLAVDRPADLNTMPTMNKANVNVLGEWIYYAEDYPSEAEGPGHTVKGIFKLKTDGTQKSQLSTNYIRDLIVQGNLIYFINDSDHGRLYKMKTDGTGITKIADDTGCSSLNLQDDHIYYLRDIDPTGIKTRLNKLYRINTDGTNKTEIPFRSTTEPIEIMIVDGNFIYYLMPSGTGPTTSSIYRMNTDGTNSL